MLFSQKPEKNLVACKIMTIQIVSVDKSGRSNFPINLGVKCLQKSYNMYGTVFVSILSS